MATLTQQTQPPQGPTRPLTRDGVRVLASYAGNAIPVLSVYLDVDGHRYVRAKDYEHQLDLLLRQARDGGAAEADVARVDSYVRAGIDRSSTHGLALFSCAARGLWEVIEVPVAVRNQFCVNHSPQVRQLEAVLERHQRFGVLLVDRQRCRLLSFELGRLVDQTDLFDALPRHEDDKGDRDKGDHLRDHEAAAIHHHVRRATQAAFDAHQDKAFDHLIVGTPADLAGDVEQSLHPWLRERIAARLNVPVGSPDHVICAAALEVEAGIEQEREAQVVERLRSAVAAPNGLGVAGLDAVVAALAERRVEVLLVSEGYEAPGWRCPACQRVALVGRACPTCTEPMHQVDDVVEEAIEDAITHSCAVVLCDANADLDVLGRIGAILRY